MRKVLIFGNSGSGKSTFAKELSKHEGLAHLDLDTLAWLPINPPQRMPIAVSETAIKDFIGLNESWVIEGCYSDLLEIAAPASNEVIFMNLPVDSCIENARNRPWEPHKYDSKAAQDANLGMLVDWISQYPRRTGVFSESAHKSFYENFAEKKRMYTSNARNT